MTVRDMKNKIKQTNKTHLQQIIPQKNQYIKIRGHR